MVWIAVEGRRVLSAIQGMRGGIEHRQAVEVEVRVALNEMEMTYLLC